MAVTSDDALALYAEFLNSSVADKACELGYTPEQAIELVKEGLQQHRGRICPCDYCFSSLRTRPTKKYPE